MDRDLTLVEHLSELRKRLIFCLVCLVLGTGFSLPFAARGLKILKLPASGLIEKLVFFGPQESFFIHMRIALLGGLVISMPVVMYEVWAFVAPAIEEKVRRLAAVFIIFCSVLFAAGVLFAYFVLIPPALKFLLTYGLGELEPVISATRYISFVTGLILACGLVFQMPGLSFILTKLGIINAGFLRRKYKYAILLIFVAAAIVTPTADVFNLLIMVVPMLLLYETSIWVSRLAEPRRKVAA